MTSQWIGGLSVVMSHLPLFCYNIAKCITKDKHSCAISLELLPQSLTSAFSLLFSLHCSVILIWNMKINLK